MSLNLHKIVTPLINNITPLQTITLKVFTGITNVKGVVSPTYSSTNSTARVQLENKQTLEHIAGINLSKIYKRFYINSNDLTGLNRALSNAGDYIVLNAVNYKIIEVIENFATGWVAVVGCQGEPS